MMGKVKKMLVEKLLYYFPHKLAHTIIYNRYHSNKIDFDNPVTYDEKLHWLMVYYYDESFADYADKIKVRDYVRNCGLEKILIPLVGKGVYSNTKEIVFDELPDRFIIKANHGSGEKYYVICQDKNAFDRELSVRKLDDALKSNYAKHYCQYHYATINPALICEKYLMTDGQERLTDYKVVCSHGKAIAVLVCNDRNNGRDYYSPDWEYLEYTKPEFRSGKLEDKPKVLVEMLDAASKLSKPFPLARVDFYVVEDKLYFGEITLTPSEGIHNNLNDVGQMELGKHIDLNREQGK